MRPICALAGTLQGRQALFEDGQDAALEAAQRADAMLERGDMDGCAVWKRIVRAVEELQRKERRD